MSLEKSIATTSGRAHTLPELRHHGPQFPRSLVTDDTRSSVLEVADWVVPLADDWADSESPHPASRSLAHVRRCPALQNGVTDAGHPPRDGNCLLEETILNLCEFHDCGAPCVIAGNGVDATAHRVAPHHPGVTRLQHVGHCSHVVHSRIEPQIITVWIKDDRHSVVNGRSHSIWSSR